MIKVRQPNNGELEEALGIVAATYMDKGYVTKMDVDTSPAAMFIAKDEAGGPILGTAGLIWAPSHSGRKRPTEEFFGFDARDEIKELHGITRSRIVETGRFCNPSRNPYVFGALVAAVGLYARFLGHEVVLACMKPGLRLRIMRLRVPLYDINKQVVPENVPPEYRGYFLPEPPEKPPVPLYFLISDFPRYMDELVLTSMLHGITLDLGIAPENHELEELEATIP